MCHEAFAHHVVLPYANRAKADLVDFYNAHISEHWELFGSIKKDTGEKPTCYAIAKWDDGSQFMLTKDLSNGEFFIWFNNLQWNMLADDFGKHLFMRLNMRDGRGRITYGADFGFEIENKNTIYIPNIWIREFLTGFVVSKFMYFVLPGQIDNARVLIEDPPKVLQELAGCSRAWTALRNKIDAEDALRSQKQQKVLPPADTPDKL